MACVTVCQIGKPLMANDSYEAHKDRPPNSATPTARPAHASSLKGSYTCPRGPWKYKSSVVGWRMVNALLMLAMLEASLPSALVTMKLLSSLPTAATISPKAVVGTLFSLPGANSTRGNLPRSGSGRSNSVTTVLAAGPPPAWRKFSRTKFQARGGNARRCKPLITSSLSKV